MHRAYSMKGVGCASAFAAINPKSVKDTFRPAACTCAQPCLCPWAYRPRIGSGPMPMHRGRRARRGAARRFRSIRVCSGQMSTQPAYRANGEPVVVSFYCGGDYYREAAEQLRQDCERVGLAHDIVEIEVAADGDWIAACRRKIPFYLEMHRKHRRPILWLDVDSRLGARPAVFDGASCDIAGFLRGFRYLRD